MPIDMTAIKDAEQALLKFLAERRSAEKLLEAVDTVKRSVGELDELAKARAKTEADIATLEADRDRKQSEVSVLGNEVAVLKQQKLDLESTIQDFRARLKQLVG